MNDDTISRKAAIEILWEEPSYSDPLNVLTDARDRIKSLPSAERHSRRKVFYHGENTWSYVCEACGTHIDEGDVYCRGCGAKMEAEE